MRAKLAKILVCRADKSIPNRFAAASYTFSIPISAMSVSRKR